MGVLVEEVIDRQQPDLLQYLPNPLLVQFPFHFVDEQGLQQDALDGHKRGKRPVGVLLDESDMRMKPVEILRLIAVEPPPVKDNLSPRKGDQSQDRAQQGSFSRAALAHDGNCLPMVKIKADPIE